MRHEVLPLLAEFNPRVDEAIVRLSTLAGTDSAYLSAAAEDLLNAATESRAESIWRLAAEPLVDAPTALLSRAVIQGWVWCAPHGSTPPSGEWIAGAVAFLRRGRGGRVPVPGGGELRRSTGWIEFERRSNGEGGDDE
jgi:tRNA(Ile)-lysidine synthase